MAAAELRTAGGVASNIIIDKPKRRPARSPPVRLDRPVIEELRRHMGPADYVPILLTKRGERGALIDLAGAVKPRMTPLFVLAPVDWDFDAAAPKRSVDAHHAEIGKDLAQSWGSLPAFVDAYFLDDSDLMNSGQLPLAHVIEQGNSHGAQLIPTVSIGRGAAFRAEVAAIVARDKRGVCFRLPTSEWPSATGAPAVLQLLGDVGVVPQEVDLVLDLAEEVSGAPGVSLTATRAEIAALPHLADWRSVIVAGAGFPKELSAQSGFGKGISVLDRAEWSLYLALLGTPGLARIPTFGDYAIAHPDPIVDVNPRFMSISAVLRYTIPGQWLVVKGDLFKGKAGTGLGGSAMNPVAAALAADPRYCGGSHCTGDAFIATAAAGGSGGGPEGWRRAGTCHHLTHLTQEIANLAAFSAGAGP